MIRDVLKSSVCRLQMQTKEVPTGVQEELSSGEDRCGKAEGHNPMQCQRVHLVVVWWRSQALRLILQSVCRQAMYRGVPKLQDGLDFRGALHWMWHLREGESPSSPPPISPAVLAWVRTQGCPVPSAWIAEVAWLLLQGWYLYISGINCPASLMRAPRKSLMSAVVRRNAPSTPS